jgi:serine/threonine-protein kinase
MGGSATQTTNEIKGEQNDPLIGRLLDGKYRLLEKLGRGSVGDIYKGEHINLGHLVAITVLTPELVKDSFAVERFRREALSAAHLSHPNVVAITDFGVTNSGIAYFVAEYLEGIELREKIDKKKQLDYEEAFLILQQVCSALFFAHNKGFLHRALTPDRIRLVKSEGGIDHIKVQDFGVAKLASYGEPSPLTQQGMIVGTPHYMSPEQCRGEEL